MAPVESRRLGIHIRVMALKAASGGATSFSLAPPRIRPPAGDSTNLAILLNLAVVLARSESTRGLVHCGTPGTSDLKRREQSELRHLAVVVLAGLGEVEELPRKARFLKGFCDSHAPVLLWRTVRPSSCTA
jgi:hypothetical protein